MPNWYPDYDDRDTPDDNDVAFIAERERRELSPHITALPSHCNPGSYYVLSTSNNCSPSTHRSSRPVNTPTTPVDLPPPTCNCCDAPMTPRMGRFGKFYFCNNGCESQPTISDKAWRLYNETI